EEAILEELAEVERRGGAIACIESGYIREVIAEGAVRRQRRYEEGTRPMVGVDRFVADDDGSWAVRPTGGMTEEAEEHRRLAVAELRRNREQRRVGLALGEVEAALRRGESSVPPVLEAVRAYATIGEISDVFRSVFGEWSP